MTTEPSERVLDLLRTRQGWAGRVLELAEHLAPGDRSLLRAVYHHGMSASEFARALGSHPRTIRHRVRRLVDRITSPPFQRILAEHRAWPEQRRAIARAVFLHGLTQREAASKLGVSLHRIRRECDRIRTLIEVATAREQTNRAQPRRYAT